MNTETVFGKAKWITGIGCYSGDVACFAYGAALFATGNPLFGLLYASAGLASGIGGLLLDTSRSKGGVLRGHAGVATGIMLSLIPGLLAGSEVALHMMFALFLGRAGIMGGTAVNNNWLKAAGSLVSGGAKIYGAVSLLPVSLPLAAILALWTCCDTRTLLNMRTPNYRP